SISPGSHPDAHQARVERGASRREANPPTNVRSTPEVAPDNIVGTLANGTYVSLSDRQNGWFKITTPVDGWISQNLTETTCASVSKRINFPPNGTRAIVKGRIIGGGSHEYILNASEGQTMTVTVIEGALPFVFPPNDPNRQRDLTGGGHYTGKDSWTGTLPATGDYLLQLDSNFRGFEYELLVSVE
ncbi:SH3 domain-containing protein, partial [Phormidium sp. CCY1219]|uniref:SH3 domain-containing protein n=1 Tax=Phormidium sp. CCY1219 TaxID=2886104 RepID=UPI002D1E7C33